MSKTSVKTYRGRFVLLPASLLAFGASGEAMAARYRHHHPHTHGLLSARHEMERVNAEMPAVPARLGAMRYYGGPKSPMWRGPVQQ